MSMIFKGTSSSGATEYTDQAKSGYQAFDPFSDKAGGGFVFVNPTSAAQSFKLPGQSPAAQAETLDSKAYLKDVSKLFDEFDAIESTMTGATTEDIVKAKQAKMSLIGDSLAKATASVQGSIQTQLSTQFGIPSIEAQLKQARMLDQSQPEDYARFGDSQQTKDLQAQLTNAMIRMESALPRALAANPEYMQLSMLGKERYAKANTQLLSLENKITNRNDALDALGMSIDDQSLVNFAALRGEQFDPKTATLQDRGQMVQSLQREKAMNRSEAQAAMLPRDAMLEASMVATDPDLAGNARRLSALHIAKDWGYRDASSIKPILDTAASYARFDVDGLIKATARLEAEGRPVINQTQKETLAAWSSKMKSGGTEATKMLLQDANYQATVRQVMQAELKNAFLGEYGMAAQVIRSLPKEQRAVAIDQLRAKAKAKLSTINPSTALVKPPSLAEIENLIASQSTSGYWADATRQYVGKSNAEVLMDLAKPELPNLLRTLFQ